MKVVGIQQMKGESKKTGKAYDAVILYVTEDGVKDVVGCRTDNIWVPRDIWDSQVGEPVSDAFIGMDLYPAYDRRGRHIFSHQPSCNGVKNSLGAAFFLNGLPFGGANRQLRILWDHAEQLDSHQINNLV